jgi:tetratricopeptide (TPR) repeat protein
MISTEVFVIIAILVAVAIALNSVGIARRVREARRLHRKAIACIGDDVSIYTDKGARYAYKGIYAYLEGNYSKALNILEKAVKYSEVSHNSSFCFEWISQCYSAQDKSMESLAYSVKAVEAEPSNVKSLFNLAEAYARDGLFSKAEFYYNMILRYDKKNATAVFMIGMLFMCRGEFEKAEVQYLKTLELDPDFAAVNAEMAVLMAIKGDDERRDEYLAKAHIRRRAESERLKKRLVMIKRVQELCSDCR